MRGLTLTLPFERIVSLTQKIQESEGAIAELAWLKKLPANPDYVEVLSVLEVLLQPALKAVMWRIRFPRTSPTLALGPRGFETWIGQAAVPPDYVARHLSPDTLEATLQAQADTLIEKLEQRSKQLDKEVKRAKLEIRRLRAKRKRLQAVLRLLQLVDEARKSKS